MIKLLPGLLIAATIASAASIPVFSTGQGLSGGQTDSHWTYSLQNSSSTTVTGHAVVLSPGNSSAGIFWVASSGSAVWISTCDSIQTLSCLPGGSGAYTTPLPVTYTTQFSLAGFDYKSASLTINWAADDCANTVTLNGNVVSPGPACGAYGSTSPIVINSGFLPGTNTLSFSTVNQDNNYEGILVDVTGTADLATAQIGYAANLGLGQSVIDLTNVGTNGGDDTADFICANVYVFAQDQQLISCCSCPLSPNDLQFLSVQSDLINNTLTPGVPTGVSVIVTATDDTGQVGCDAATATGGFVGGLNVWGSTVHKAPLGALAVTETRFLDFTLKGAGPGSELFKMTSLCGFIESNGSGFGICNTCTSGAAGAKKK